MEFNRHLHALRGLLQWEYWSSIGISFFPAAGEAIRPVSWEGTLLDPTIYLGFGWMGVPLFFVLSGYLLGGQVLDVRLNGAFSQTFLAEAISSHLSSGVGRANHFARAGNGHHGLISARGLGHAPASVFAMDQFCLRSWRNLLTACGGRFR